MRFPKGIRKSSLPWICTFSFAAYLLLSMKMTSYYHDVISADDSRVTHEPTRDKNCVNLTSLVELSALLDHFDVVDTSRFVCGVSNGIKLTLEDLKELRAKINDTVIFQESVSLLLWRSKLSLRSSTNIAENGPSSFMAFTPSPNPATSGSPGKLSTSKVEDCVKVSSLDNVPTPLNKLDLRLVCTSTSAKVRLKDLYQLRRATTEIEKQFLYSLILAFTSVANELDIPYFLYGGGLLGSFRHHDMMPWDGDCDFMVNVVHRSRLVRGLQSLDSNIYGVYKARSSIKIFFKGTSRAGEYKWNWPYVDIFQYVVNKTHLWELGRKKRCYHPLSDIFPLHLRPYGPLWLSAPRNTYRALEVEYFGKLNCEEPWWDHKGEHTTENARHPTKIPCKDLRDFVPFAHRSLTRRGRFKETLRMGDEFIREVIVDEPPTSVIVPPYT